jgi:hypothetical protein
MEHATMAITVSETLFRRKRNLVVAHGREIVPNAVVELLCYRAHGQKVPAKTGRFVL